MGHKHTYGAESGRYGANTQCYGAATQHYGATSLPCLPPWRYGADTQCYGAAPLTPFAPQGSAQQWGSSGAAEGTEDLQQCGVREEPSAAALSLQKWGKKRPKLGKSFPMGTFGDPIPQGETLKMP